MGQRKFQEGNTKEEGMFINSLLYIGKEDKT